jgi:hypothetical protein
MRTPFIRMLRLLSLARSKLRMCLSERCDMWVFSEANPTGRQAHRNQREGYAADSTELAMFDSFARWTWHCGRGEPSPWKIPAAHSPHGPLPKA